MHNFPLHIDIELYHSVFSKYPEINEVIVYGQEIANEGQAQGIAITLVGNQITRQLAQNISSEIKELPVFALAEIEISAYQSLDCGKLLKRIKETGRVLYARVAYE